MRSRLQPLPPPPKQGMRGQTMTHLAASLVIHLIAASLFLIHASTENAMPDAQFGQGIVVSLISGRSGTNVTRRNKTDELLSHASLHEDNIPEYDSNADTADYSQSLPTFDENRIENDLDSLLEYDTVPDLDIADHSRDAIAQGMTNDELPLAGEYGPQQQSEASEFELPELHDSASISANATQTEAYSSQKNKTHAGISEQRKDNSSSKKRDHESSKAKDAFIGLAGTESKNSSKTLINDGQKFGSGEKANSAPAAQTSGTVPTGSSAGQTDSMHPAMVPFNGAGGPSYKKLVMPAYPLSARRKGLEGFVRLSLDISADGTLAKCSVKQSSDPVFTQPALEATRKSTYNPYMRNGLPVPCRTSVIIRFALER